MWVQHNRGKTVANSLASKVSGRTWTGSVPPRGSGWVRSHVATDLLIAGLKGYAPTGYREVVLTRSKNIVGFLRGTCG
jgi:hypothetical protein